MDIYLFQQEVQYAVHQAALHILVDDTFKGEGHRECPIVIALIRHGGRVAIVILHGTDGSASWLQDIGMCGSIMIGVGDTIEVEILL